MLLQQAWNYLNDAKYSKALEMCENYLNSGDTEFVMEANKLAALALFQQKKFKNSIKYYETIAKKTDASEDWFNLTMASNLSGDNLLSFRSFEKAIDSYETSDSTTSISIPNMRFFFMKDLLKTKKYKEAFEQLEKLRAIYEEHEITDSTYLYMNSTPNLKEVMDYSVEILSNNKTKEEATEWFLNFSEKLDISGKELLKVYYI